MKRSLEKCEWTTLTLKYSIDLLSLSPRTELRRTLRINNRAGHRKEDQFSAFWTEEVHRSQDPSKCFVRGGTTGWRKYNTRELCQMMSLRT
ncbi:hypothetical protein JTE90_012695 [Oedothorax gibbosus]|uniref:Uncharacterized protein n=1 Tax=Oedothorax gibbosus TaxID=931172 RepID=A0AAV6VYS3_9ARAC|nr:hypothetical protein JTE90_012695 [Oedothorax gibbosus]